MIAVRLVVPGRRRYDAKRTRLVPGNQKGDELVSTVFRTLALTWATFEVNL